MRRFKNSYAALLPLCIALVFAGCDTVNPSAENISDEDLEIAGEIIAESLSDDNGGFMSSLYDAFSEVRHNEIRYQREGMAGPQGHGNGNNPRSGRGAEAEFNSEYNPDTGEHTVSFRRNQQTPGLTKTLSVLNVYIFTDGDGNFLEFPNRENEKIETIDFKGTRSGTSVTQRRSSSYTRTDTLFVSGASSASTVLMLDGTHSGQGEMVVDLKRANRSMQRTYEVQFEMQNIQVDKEVVRESGSLEEGITGIISYRLKMTNTINGETREQEVTGTIELAGDGSALLRFENVRDLFSITLRNGEINL